MSHDPEKPANTMHLSEVPHAFFELVQELQKTLGKFLRDVKHALERGRSEKYKMLSYSAIHLPCDVNLRKKRPI